MANNEIINNTPLDRIKELIYQFEHDKTIKEIQNSYNTPTIWDIIKKTRSETCHTQFLAWLFNNKDFKGEPIKKLLNLLQEKALQQSKNYNKDLANSIKAKTLSIETYEAEAEKGINYKSSTNKPSYGKGSIDIFIKCKTSEGRKINIVIENKIDAPETIKKKNEEILYQTQAYYDYITKEYSNAINIFVFLKPTYGAFEELKSKDKCYCKEYIQINYQDILEKIIQPINSKKKITERDSSLINDYIKILGKPSETKTKKTIIMAIEDTKKKLLKDFFIKNQDIIRLSLNALDDPKLSAIVENINKKGKIKKLYSINGDGELEMSLVVERFIRFRISQEAKVVDINQEIKDFLGTDTDKVSDSDDILVERGDDRRIKEIKDIEGHPTIKYSNQWGVNTNPTNDFNRFLNRVNEKYKGIFYIERI